MSQVQWQSRYDWWCSYNYACEIFINCKDIENCIFVIFCLCECFLYFVHEKFIIASEARNRGRPRWAQRSSFCLYMLASIFEIRQFVNWLKMLGNLWNACFNRSIYFSMHTKHWSLAYSGMPLILTCFD